MPHPIQHNRRGSAVLDAALVFPVLLLLTFGCVEFGHYFYIKHTLQGAAREGARAAATGVANSEVTTAVANTMSAAGISAYTVAIRDAADTTNITIGTATPVAGTAILVKVTCVWGTVGVRPMGLMGASKQVIGMTTMRREG